MHPVQLVYDRLTSVVASAMPDPAETDSPCSYCNRPSSEFGGKGYVGKDGYKQAFICCPACHSFSIGDIAIMGIESIRGKGSPVSQKFGMWPGVSAAIELDSGRAVLLPPKGVYDKFPERFLVAVETVVLPSKGRRIPWVIQNMRFPLLYIADFGKTTPSLIANLRISETPKELLAISDKQIERINARAAMDIHACLEGVAKKEVDLFETTVRALAIGTLTPREANKVWAEYPSLTQAARMLPTDPHQRLSLITFLRNTRA
jgi:hypothetical protein